MLKLVANTFRSVEHELDVQLFESQSDLIHFDLSPCYVRNGSLFGGFDNFHIHLPGSIFPYGRLASIHTSSTAYLYHQVNGSILVEEMMALTQGLGAWIKPNIISIPAH